MQSQTMKKIRINELARQLEIPSHEILEVLNELGVAEKKTHSSSIDDDVADKIRRRYSGNGAAVPERPPGGQEHGAPAGKETAPPPAAGAAPRPARVIVAQSGCHAGRPRAARHAAAAGAEGSTGRSCGVGSGSYRAIAERAFAPTGASGTRRTTRGAARSASAPR